MRKVLSIGFFTAFVVFVFSLIIPELALGQQNPVGSLPVSVKAQVGDYYLSLSGYIAPNASVTLISGNIVLRSTTADSKGYFFISQVLVKRGFSDFCLDAIDFRRLGESEACFHITPVNGPTSMQNIFLPPTLGLFQTKINAGSQALAFGYSMPGAKVTVHLPDGTVYTTTADKTGYYEFHIKIDKPGQYELFADAVYNGKKSENPVKKVLLTALGLPEQVTGGLLNFWNKLWKFLLSIPLGPLWLAIPVLILIFILLRKLKPGIFSWIPSSLPAFDFLKHKKKLHHAWFVGY
ncbi:MAG: carboxypeptidase-like regulatory domain-containing protein [Candidatus Levyibacteriota bacterium]